MSLVVKRCRNRCRSWCVCGWQSFTCSMSIIHQFAPRDVFGPQLCMSIRMLCSVLHHAILKAGAGKLMLPERVYHTNSRVKRTMTVAEAQGYMSSHTGNLPTDLLKACMRATQAASSISTSTAVPLAYGPWTTRSLYSKSIGHSNGQDCRCMLQHTKTAWHTRRDRLAAAKLLHACTC